MLLSNALRHGDGPATVTMRRVQGRVEVEISDAGPGVDPSVRARLFDPEAPKPDGHGIGLPLARLLVDAEGGTLDLVDPATATFRIRLAAAPPGNLDGPRGER